MITITEGIPQKMPGFTTLMVEFSYNPVIVSLMKSLPAAAWITSEKKWEIPTPCLSELLDKICLYDDIKLNLLHTVEPQEQVFELSQYKSTPFDYQIDGIQFGLNHDNFLLLDVPGLGKSLQSIYIALERYKRGQVKHCLVVCGVNTLKSNWKHEIEKHTDLSCRILGERINRRGRLVVDGIPKRLEQLQQPIEEFFVITNIETLRNEKIVKEIASGKHNKFEMCILDEAHKCKSPTSEQSKGLLKINNIAYKIAMTGTLLVSNPVDAFVPLKWIGVENSTYTNFKFFYCNFSGPYNNILTGFKNTAILQDMLSKCSIRRTKDILNLPEKIVINEYVDLEDDQWTFYENIKDGIVDQVDKVELNSANILALLGRLRQATAFPSMLTTEHIESAKIQRACDIVDEICSDPDNKVVIFSTFKETAKELCNRLQAYHPTLNTGDVPSEIIEEHKEDFQNTDNSRVFVATWQKCGTGITLTRANTVIFIDTPYTASDFGQAQDRCHRVGTNSTVTVYNLIAKDTVDERVLEIINDKALLSDYIIDNQISPNLQLRLKQIITDL